MNLELHIHNSYCQLLPRLHPDISYALDEMLAFGVEGARFSQAYVNKRWDGKKHMYTASKQTFPTGFLADVVTKLHELDVQFTLKDCRVVPTLPDSVIPLSIPPWPHQERIFEACAATPRGLIQAATGAGKTASLAGVWGMLNVPGVILTFRRELMYQLRDHLKRYLGEPVGIFGDGVWEEGKLTVAMAPSLMKVAGPQYSKLLKEFEEGDEKTDDLIIAKKLDLHKKLIQDTRFVAIDEVHRAAARGAYAVIQAMNGAYWRYGFSATAYGFRDDKQDYLIKAAVGDVLLRVTTTDLVNSGHLVPTDVVVVDFSHKGRHYSRENYTEYYTSAVVQNTDRNRAVINLAYGLFKQGRHVLISVQRVEHGKLLEEYLKYVAGEDNVKFVYGEDSKSFRKEHLGAFAERRLPILVSTLVSEGIDWPCVTGDTEITLLDGTRRTVKELCDGGAKDFWVYSCTPAGDIQPAKAGYVKLTKKNAEVVKVTLDSGKSFKCTPDHLVLMRDGSYQPAGMLQPGASLMPLYPKFSRSGYEQVYNPATRSQKFTHRLVRECLHGPIMYSPGHEVTATRKKISSTTRKTLKGKIIPQPKAMWSPNAVRQKGPGFHPNNHKVVSVTPCGREDVYDMMDVTPNNNFGLACGVFVHNCLDTVINCRGEESRIATIQLMGRSMRKYPGKDRALYIDILDSGTTWLGRHSKTRMSVYNSEAAFNLIPVKLEEIHKFITTYGK